MKKKITLSLFLIPILPCLIIGGYYTKLVMSESIRFTKDSIEYRLLTPDIIKNIRIEDIGKVKRYYYSAADGNKPPINAVEFGSSKDKKYLETIITQYFITNNFTHIKSGEFKKGNQEASVLFDKNASNTWNISITVLEMIK